MFSPEHYISRYWCFYVLPYRGFRRYASHRNARGCLNELKSHLNIIDVLVQSSEMESEKGIHFKSWRDVLECPKSWSSSQKANKKYIFFALGIRTESQIKSKWQLSGTCLNNLPNISMKKFRQIMQYIKG